MNNTDNTTNNSPSYRASKSSKSPFQKLSLAGKIGRGICILLILVICGHTVYNVFRLIDSFNESDVELSPKDVEKEEEISEMPIISFDADGQWLIPGLHQVDSPDVTLQPIMSMPASAVLVGSRTDKDGKPLMQLFEYPCEHSANETEPEKLLLESWSEQGWKVKRIDLPDLVSYRCTSPEKHCLVQFFSDKTKIYVLLCLSM